MNNYKDVYMLTIIYTGGRTIDLEFESENDRREFFRCVKDADVKFTFWVQGKER